MVETTLDLLYIVLAGAVGVLTIFLCWAIYYVVRMLRNAVYMVEKVTVVMQKADEVLDLAKEKLHSTGTYLGIAANVAKGVMDYMGEKGTPIVKKVRKKVAKRKSAKKKK